MRAPVSTDIAANRSWQTWVDLHHKVVHNTAQDLTTALATLQCDVAVSPSFHPNAAQAFGLRIQHSNSGKVTPSQSCESIGPSAVALQRSADKLQMKACLKAANIPVPPEVQLASASSFYKNPVIMKPRFGGLGYGVTRVFTMDEAESRHHASGADELIERYIDGIEIQVVMLRGRLLGCAEVRRMWNADGQLELGLMEVVCPPRIGKLRLAGLTRLARHAASVLDLGHGLVRVDALISERDNEYILEVEAMPLCGRDSVVARVAYAAGMTYESFVAAWLLPYLPTLKKPAQREQRSVPCELQ